MPSDVKPRVVRITLSAFLDIISYFILKYILYYLA